MRLEVELPDAAAWEFAQFLKRSTWETYRALAVGEDDTRLMVDACERLREALVKAGVDPR